MNMLPHQHEPRGLVAIASGHTPTMSKSVCNPVPPGVQKALDRRRRFTLIRPGTRAALQAGRAENRGARLLPGRSTVRRATAEGRRR